jgi:hypothetical protein
MQKFRELGLFLDMQFGNEGHRAMATLVGSLTSQWSEYFLNVVDWCLHQTGYQEDADEAAQLLERARSMWDVGQKGAVFQLVHRVDPTVAAAVATAAPAGTSAAFHLANAWDEVHSRSGNPKTAYDEAVLAAEAATKPIVSPNDANYTLGRGIGAMGANSTAWNSPLGNQGVTMTVETMKALWWANRRHGSETPVTVTHSEAEMAVQLGVTLVRLFSSGGTTST